MEDSETSIPPPVSPLTAKINLAILGFYFDHFAKKYLPAFVPVITSGYRDAAKNSEVGGEQNSAHLHGLAYDFVLQYPGGQEVPKLQAKQVFDNFIQPNWPGYALWEEAGGVWHVHVNLSRKITEYASIIGLTAIGVVGFKMIQNWGKDHG